MQPVNGVDQAHDAATISSPPTEHSEDLPQLPEDLKIKLKEPLPREAVSPNQQKPGLSGIKVIYVVERLNEDRKSTRLNSSHESTSRMPSSA